MPKEYHLDFLREDRDQERRDKKHAAHQSKVGDSALDVFHCKYEKMWFLFLVSDSQSEAVEVSSHDKNI